MKVLVIDDSEIVGSMVQYIIELDPQNSVSISQSIFGIENIHSYDLIILDHYVDRVRAAQLTGVDFLHSNVSQINAEVIVCSGNLNPKVIRAYKKLGVENFIDKNYHSFLDELQSILSKSRIAI